MNSMNLIGLIRFPKWILKWLLIYWVTLEPRLTNKFIIFFLCKYVNQHPIFESWFFLYGLCRFNGKEFLMQMRGKTVMFVGDSLGRNQWESLICMTWSAVQRTPTKMIRGDPLSTFKFLVNYQYYSYFTPPKFWFIWISWKWIRIMEWMYLFSEHRIWWILMAWVAGECWSWMRLRRIHGRGWMPMCWCLTLVIGGLIKAHFKG